MKKPPVLCMFCGNAPCTCDGPVKQRSTSRKTKPSLQERSTPPVEAPTSPVVPAGGVDSVFDDEKLERAPRFKAQKQISRDLSMESAIRIILLAGILSPQSASEVEIMLTPPLRQDIDRRLSEWKDRHGLLD